MRIGPLTVKQALLRASYHEAGHAGMTFLLGGHVKWTRVRIERRPQGGLRGGMTLTVVKSPMQNALVAVSGMIAESMRFRHMYQDRLEGSDLESFAQFYRSNRIVEFVRTARPMLRIHWTAFDTLAVELNRCGSLTGKEAREAFASGLNVHRL